MKWHAKYELMKQTQNKMKIKITKEKERKVTS
jgi:hypothetical protein